MEEEFREFVAARSAALLRTAYLLAGDWATAEDLLQTALTKTYLAWKRLGEIEAVEPYARRVLVNTATSGGARVGTASGQRRCLPEHAALWCRVRRAARTAGTRRQVQRFRRRQRAVRTVDVGGRCVMGLLEDALRDNVHQPGGRAARG